MRSPLKVDPLSPIPKRFGAVVVTFQSEDVIAYCLESLVNRDYRVVVVDNASIDKTVQIAHRYPVHVISNDTNRGFAAAANQGFEALQEDLILLLNPDVTLSGNLDQLLPAFVSPRVGVVTAPLTDPTGLPQSQFQFRRLPSPTTLLFETLGVNRLLPFNPINRRYRYLDRQWDEPCDVEQPAGAFLLIRRQAWQALGGFDEVFYPLWFEDVDFCKRLLQEGWLIQSLPVTLGSHSGGHSIRDLEPGVRQLYWYRSLLRYCEKHFSVLWVRILALSAIVALAAKAFIMAIRLGHQGNPAKLSPAAHLAFRTFIHGRHPNIGSPVA